MYRPPVRNIRVLLGVSVLFGVGAGLYEFTLPFYLKGRGLSYPDMGWLFAASAAVMVAIRLATGRLVDRWGCKRPYLLAAMGSALTGLLTALTGNIAFLTVLKTGREVCVVLRDTVHPVVLYIEDRVRFRDHVGRIRGFEMLSQAAGTVLAGAAIVVLGHGGSIAGSGLVLAASGALLAFGLADRRPAASQAPVKGSLWRWDMDNNLKVIMLSGFLYNAGLSMSHGFLMPLFFSARFGASQGDVSVILFLHRLTPVLPLLLAGRLRFRNLKLAYLSALALQGVLMAAGGFIPRLVPATAVWLLHDFVGIGVWLPIQNEIIQRHCREAVRGLDLSKTLVLSSAGGAVGPLLAGFLAERTLQGTWILSGAFLVAAAAVLFRLRLEAAADAAAAAAARS